MAMKRVQVAEMSSGSLYSHYGWKKPDPYYISQYI